MEVRFKFLAAWSMVMVLSVARLSAAGDLRLVNAAAKGNKEEVRSLLKEHVDVNAPQADGATALAWTVHRDDLETADLLIHAGANVNAANDYGVTPLALACTNRNAAMADLLLKAGANPNAALWTGETTLMTCAGTGFVDTVKLLLDHKADVNAKEKQKDQTALMWAIAKKHPDAVKLLIERGADVHARSKVVEAPQPFVVACTAKDPCLNGKFDGNTYAASIHFPKTEGGFTPLLFAAQQGDIESARMLLAAGADVNESTPEEGTALVIASASGHEKLALFLLENGANPNAKDGFGVTPLHYALHEGLLSISGYKPEPTDRFGWERPNMPELAKALLQHGADPNARIAWDFPPYDYAPVSRSNGNDLPQISLVGATPFLFAAATGDLGMMKMLVEGHANAKLTTTEGTTPLMVAAGVGHERGSYAGGAREGTEYVKTSDELKRLLEAVKLAVELGGDINAANVDGRTALQAAVFLNQPEIVQFLVEKGANLEAKDKYGETAMSIALGDPEGLVYRQLGGGRYDYSFRQPKNNPKMAELLVKLGAKPFTGKRRDRSGE
jgi:ankyrin repeat protein